MMMLQRESLNQPSSHLAKRKEAVAVTAPTVALPSGFRVAAGEQWKLAEPRSSGEAGSPAPSSTRALVDALPRRVDPAREIYDRADLERGQLFRRRRQLQADGL
jgi:hypothetical protein